MMKNANYFILKSLLFLRYIESFPDFFYNLGKRLDTKASINFKTDDFSDCKADNYYAHTVQYP